MIPESKKCGGRKLGLLGRQSITANPGREFPPESKDRCLSDQEIEAKFNSISLSLRTEAFTLQHRLEHQRRQRDLCEANMKKETEQLVSFIKVLQQEMARLLSSHYNNDGTGSQQLYEKFSRALQQVDVVSSSARRVSSAAETLGAVEHEWRLSSSVDLLIEYVDNVKRKWEKEHRELDETKRILQESGLNLEECFAALNPALDSLPPANFNTRRRASVPAAPLSRKISLLASPLKLAFRSSVTVEERDEDFKAATKEPSPVHASMANPPGSSIVEEEGSKAPLDDVIGVEMKQPIATQKEKSANYRKRRISRFKNSSRNSKRELTNSSSYRIFLLSQLLHAYWEWTNRNVWQRCAQLVCKQADGLRQKTKWRTGGRNNRLESQNVLRWVRYTFAGLCLLAAVISLVITFVPADSLL